MVQVRTLLEMPELRLSARVGDELLDREVSRVCAAELPNPSRYLNGGELVISELLWWQRPEDADVFVRALAEHGAAALAASGAGLGEVPEGLQRSCEHYGVALLEVTPDLPCTVIAERAELALTAEREPTEPDGHRRLLRPRGADCRDCCRRPPPISMHRAGCVPRPVGWLPGHPYPARKSRWVYRNDHPKP